MSRTLSQVRLEELRTDFHSLLVAVVGEPWSFQGVRDYLADNSPLRLVAPLYRLLGRHAIGYTCLVLILLGMITPRALVELGVWRTLAGNVGTTILLLAVAAFSVSTIMILWNTTTVDAHGRYLRNNRLVDLPREMFALVKELQALAPGTIAKVTHTGMDPILWLQAGVFRRAYPARVWDEHEDGTITVLARR